MPKISDEDRASKLTALRHKYKKAVDDAAGQVLKVGEEKSRKLKAIFADAAKIGFSTKSFKKVMTAYDHLHKARGVLEDVKALDDEATLNEFASGFVILDGDDQCAGLPLFASATQRELREAAAKAHLDEDDEANNVTPLRKPDSGDKPKGAKANGNGKKPGGGAKAKSDEAPSSMVNPETAAMSSEAPATLN